MSAKPRQIVFHRAPTRVSWIGPLAVSGALALLIGCGKPRPPVMSQLPRESTRIVTQGAPASDRDTVAIAARADSIDRYAAAHKDQVKLFAQVPGDSQLVPVKDSTAWPDSTETSYDIVFDSLHRPLLHVTSPTSESGDWTEEDAHYFGPDGRTILYDVKISSFGSGCGEVLREEKRVFLGPTGRIIHEARRFTDGNDKPINADTCYRRTDSVPPPRLSASDLPFPGSLTASDSASPHTP